MKSLAGSFGLVVAKLTSSPDILMTNFAFILPETDSSGIEVVSSRIFESNSLPEFGNFATGLRAQIEPILWGLLPQVASSKELLLSKASAT